MIFLYGFEPFDEFEYNVSALVIARLPRYIQDKSRVFPVTFSRSMFEDALNNYRPRYVLGLGQSRGGDKLRIERYAQNTWAKRNEVSAPICLGSGNMRREMKWSLPLKEICEYGEDAGTYVCNFSMWVCDEWAAMHSAQSAFLHIPASFDVPMAAEYIEWLIAKVQREE